MPACRSCNTSKCNSEVNGWLRRKRLDERAFLLRHREISAALVLRFKTEGAGGGRSSDLARSPTAQQAAAGVARRPPQGLP